jgi:hypothetical protein
MMKASKIKAKATYHKVIKELNDFGYIVYNPSYDPFKGSSIHMINFESGKDSCQLPVDQIPDQKTNSFRLPDNQIPVSQSKDGTATILNHEQVLNQNLGRLTLNLSKKETGKEISLPKNGTATAHQENNYRPPNEQVPDQNLERLTPNLSKKETGKEISLPKNGTATAHQENSYRPYGELVPYQNLVPYINNNKHINIKTRERSHENSCSNNDRVNRDEKERISNGQSKKRNPGGAAAGRMPSSLDDVRLFFEEERSTLLEAKKFFNHFESNGWKVAGRTPIRDWRAAARKWMLNDFNFNKKPKAGALQTTTKKNYAEPL